MIKITNPEIGDVITKLKQLYILIGYNNLYIEVINITTLLDDLHSRIEVLCVDKILIKYD